jgi:hypothetical protein
MSKEYTFRAQLWEAGATASWVFVTVPHVIADEIEERQKSKVAFGSVKVEAVVGATRWRTSLFPDARIGSFVLPIKRSVREAEMLDVGDEADVSVTPIDG